MLTHRIFMPVALAAAAAAQSSNSTIVCVAGQCLQGSTNTTLGGTLNIPSNPPILLLPGQYTSSSQPQLLHDALVSSQTTLSLSMGFSNSSTSSQTTPSLPLTVAVQPGILSFASPLYQGDSSYTPLPTNRSSLSTPITPGSYLPAPNTWAAFTSSAARLIIWDAIPDLSQLPASSLTSSFVLTDVQSAACTPACASTGTCTPSGTCACAPGFNGTSCETCGAGFFGPSCQPCPADCEKCDEGLTGTGKCLVPLVKNKPASCNCLNGACGDDGKCVCNEGWQDANNGTACASCKSGFFLNSKGDCEVCGIGCTQCADSTGECTTCKANFTQDAQSRSSCVPSTTGTAKVCPDGAFNDNGTCQVCASQCQTCSGPTSNDCIVCATGSFLDPETGSCVSADASGVCAGTKLFANNLKKECDSCPAKCTSCNIPNFTGASTPDSLQCTGCLPGSVLSQGKCVDQCPPGTFISADGTTCSACDSSCTTCTGNSTFCLTCSSSKLASNGTCTTSCPPSTFSSSGACLSCHPDCATCSGSSFNQCSTCPPSRPVLSNGRCLPTCGRNEFLDSTGKCTGCDASCASCAGNGPGQCLACAEKGSVLVNGQCVAANCTASSSVVPGLGVCLSTLVKVDPAKPDPLPTLTIPPPTATPEPSTGGSGGRRLTWWEILLMALGCAFIFVVFMWLWRRHARKRRAKRTAAFARRLDQREVWRRRFARFAELFSSKHKKAGKNGVIIGNPEMMVMQDVGKGSIKETEYEKLIRMREEEARRHQMEMEKLEREVARSLAEGKASRQPSIRSSISRSHSKTPSQTQHHLNVSLALHPTHTGSKSLNPNRTSAPSLYSQLTGLPRSGPEPKQPTKDFDMRLSPDHFENIDLERGDRLLSSRFSVTTAATSLYRDRTPEELPPMPEPIVPMTDAEAYAAAHKPHIENAPVAQQATPFGSYWLVPADREHVGVLVDVPGTLGTTTMTGVQPQNTGSSSTSQFGSRNPFRR